MAGVIKPTTVDKAMIAADPAAAFVGYLSTILATFGLFEYLGLSADQVAILGGAVLGLVATVRVFHEKGRRAAEVVFHTAHEELKRRTSQFEKASPEELEELRKHKRPAAES
jgi:small neutral amino acid transporter SnatA (MarC family)